MRLSEAKILAAGYDADPSMGDVIYDWAVDHATEEVFDDMGDFLVAILPLPIWLAPLRGLIRRAFDSQTPEVPLRLLRYLLDRVGLDVNSDRRRAWDDVVAGKAAQ